jgi:hypothetical protein
VTREGKIFRKIFGASAHRRLLQLFAKAAHPIVALRVAHPSWNMPYGKLARFSIPTAQKMARRGLDKLLDPELVAVGIFRVFARQDGYLVELHQLVAGATGAKLERAFRDARAQQVENVGRAIHSLLHDRLPTRGPSVAWKTLQSGEELVSSSEHWPEYIAWLRTYFRGLVFRYGCDRYLNKLENKRSRKKVKRKGHPYPHWLEPFWFDGPWWDKNVVELRPRIVRARRRRLSDLNDDPDDFKLESDDD